jgi:hypothetical protein
MNKTVIKIFFSILFTLNTFQTIAQGVNAEAKLDTNNILIGKQVWLTLQTTTHSSDTVLWPQIADTLKKEIEVLERSKIDTIYSEGNFEHKTLRQQLLLTSFDSGYHAIKPFRFIINGKEYETEPLLLEVHTVAIDTSKGIADIKEPISVNYSFVDWVKDNWPYIIYGVVAVAAIAGAIYYFKKKKKIPIQVFKPKPVKPAHLIALEKLNALKEKKLWQQEKVKEYHIELSEIIREYIENRFKIQALEQTTPEIIFSFRTIDIPAELKNELNRTLTLSDLVKFAKENPLPGENENALTVAFNFVHSTTIEILNNNNGNTSLTESENLQEKDGHN